jgi:hypothetical protein
MPGSMTRRNFFPLLGAAGVPAPLRAWQGMARPGKLKITAVEMLRVEGERDSVAGVDRQHQVQPLHVYDQFRPKEYSDAANPSKTTSRPSVFF